MTPQFKKATKYGTKLRAALFGVSGSGKTYTALRLATGIVQHDGGRIAVICTERGSARKYSDRFDFDVCDLDVRTIEGYTAALQAAGGYSVIVVDSLSHGWRELLEEVDRAANANRGNKFSGWRDASPKQKRFIDVLLNSPAHIIVTMRSETEWQTGSDEKGRMRPVRIGLKPEQGKNIEFEFDILLEISAAHIAEVIKDRTGRYQDVLIDKPDEQFGAELAAWLSEGEPPPPPIIQQAIPSAAQGAPPIPSSGKY